MAKKIVSRRTLEREVKTLRDQLSRERCIAATKLSDEVNKTICVQIELTNTKDDLEDTKEHLAEVKADVVNQTNRLNKLQEYTRNHAYLVTNILT